MLSKWQPGLEPTLSLLNHTAFQGIYPNFFSFPTHLAWDQHKYLMGLISWPWWKDPDAGKDWRQKKGMTEDEMVGWHHRLDGHEFEQAPGAGEGQGSLACCSPWGRKELDTTERLNNNNQLTENDFLKKGKTLRRKEVKMMNGDTLISSAV